MKSCAAVLAALVALALPAVAGAQTAPPAVVELFTSQGCPACPPAEAYLRDLAARRDVIALEFHIDYYDYAGWKDPYGRSEYTRRWRAYAQSLGARYEYTPFMVVDGRAHLVGSNRGNVEGRLRAHRASTGELPRLDVDINGDTATIRVAGDAPVGIYDILLVTYDKENRTRVRAGENRGMTLIEANVVRGFIRIGQWAGAPVSIDAPLGGMDGDGGCAVLVQRAGGGPIVAAAAIPFGG